MAHVQLDRAGSMTGQAAFRRWSLFGLWIAASSLLLIRPLLSVVEFALRNDDASHIFLIPFISAGLIYLQRDTIFQTLANDLAGAGILGGLTAVFGALTIWYRESWTISERAAAYMVALVLIWITGFVLFFGRNAAQAARFPLLFLFLAIPLPDFLLAHAVYLLQRGSAELAAGIFDLTNVPYLREGFVFRLSTVSIEIAEECSGIRSSMAVLILALLAAHFYLRTFWRQAVFIVSSLAIMIIKNGVRIATLTILSIYVNPSFLFGRLHRQGGVVFFSLGLALLVPVLWLLKRSENPPAEQEGVSLQKSV
jgi:exosortase